jgi:hypothetical protein
MNIGGNTNLIYDDCSYHKELRESTSPLNYQLYQGKFINCQSCIYDKFYPPYALVDIETELRNQTRPLSNCDNFKYHPRCMKSGLCISTYDRTLPVVLEPSLCPIVHNNNQRQSHPGYILPKSYHCKNEIFYRKCKN